MYHGERLNSVTHLVGAVFALAAFVVLVVSASLQGDPWKIVSATVYGTTLLLLYTFSTLYHSLRGRAKIIFQKLDHCSIYLLIAGSYTPFTLVTLREGWGWALFAAVWSLAVLGIVQELLVARGARIVSIVIYLLMGWLALIAIGPLADALPGAGLAWTIAGGAVYTLGIVFYALDNKLAHNHGLWHLFVLGGSAIHFGVVMGYVI